MLYWALVFFIVSLVAALFGFTGIAAATAALNRVQHILMNEKWKARTTLSLVDICADFPCGRLIQNTA